MQGCLHKLYFKEMFVELDSGTQGCGLRRITRTRKVHNHKILGAQHVLVYYMKNS